MMNEKRIEKDSPDFNNNNLLAINPFANDDNCVKLIDNFHHNSLKRTDEENLYVNFFKKC
jgi:hypothetical protein